MSRQGSGAPMAGLPRVADTAARPAPLVHPETQPFWDGLAEGELRVQACEDCGTRRFPFAPVCHACRSFRHAWEALPPEGTVAAAVLVRRATGDPVWSAHVPFISGSVDVAHGLRLPGRILCDCGGALVRGAAVRAVVLDGAVEGEPPVHAWAHTCRGG